MIQHLPWALQMLMEFEQKHLWMPERVRALRYQGEFDRQFLPENGGVFELPCFWVQRRYLYMFGAPNNASMGCCAADRNVPDGRVLFTVHPTELRYYADFLRLVRARETAEDGFRFWATPTSSTRTLLVWPDGQPQGAFFAKLSLHSRLFGDRRLPRRKVAVSVGLARFVQECRSERPYGIKYFDEPVGLTPRKMPDSGVVFRSVPQEVLEGVPVAPLFALMGGCEGHPPLLWRLIEMERNSGRRVLEQVLLVRFASLWVDLVFDLGLILEAHGQDLLLTLSPDLVPLGEFYYRDFEGLAVDWMLRRARGLPEHSLPDTFEWFSTYETWGHPMYQLVSRKLFMSLYHYLHLVLGELESALLEWEASGVVIWADISKGKLTLLFSHYLRLAIRDKFGMSERENYDIRQHLSRFVKFLMRVRTEVLQSCPERNGAQCDFTPGNVSVTMEGRSFERRASPL